VVNYTENQADIACKLADCIKRKRMGEDGAGNCSPLSLTGRLARRLTKGQAGGLLLPEVLHQHQVAADLVDLREQ
jgi:hypothetical protein